MSEAGDYVGTILPSVVLALSGAGLAGPTLAAGSHRRSRAWLLGLAITAIVVTASPAFGHAMAHTSIPSIAAQLNSYHAGLLVAAGGAALGALIALVGIRKPPVDLEVKREGLPL